MGGARGGAGGGRRGLLGREHGRELRGLAGGGRRGRLLLEDDYSDDREDYSDDDYGAGPVETRPPPVTDDGDGIDDKDAGEHGRELRGFSDALGDALNSTWGWELLGHADPPNCECACCLPGECASGLGLEVFALSVATPTACQPEACTWEFPEACPEPGSRLAEPVVGESDGEVFATYFDCLCGCTPDEEDLAVGTGGVTRLNFFAGSERACSPARCGEMVASGPGCPDGTHPSAAYTGLPPRNFSAPPQPTSGAFVAGVVVGALGLAAIAAAVASAAVQAWRGRRRDGTSTWRERRAALALAPGSGSGSSWEPADTA